MKNLLFTIAAFLLAANSALAIGNMPNLAQNVSAPDDIISSSPSTTFTGNDPREEGYWIITVNKDNEEMWYPLKINLVGNYETFIDFHAMIFGSRAHIYYCVNGQLYGAPAQETPVILGDALQNELKPYYPSSGNKINYYTLAAGYSYYLGTVFTYLDTGEFDKFYVNSARVGTVGAQTMLGDVDLDFEVTISDVTVLIDYLLNGDSNRYVDMYNADLEQDGVVNIADVTSLIDLLLQK